MHDINSFSASVELMGTSMTKFYYMQYMHFKHVDNLFTINIVQEQRGTEEKKSEEHDLWYFMIVHMPET